MGQSKTFRYRKSKESLDRRIVNQLKLHRYRNIFLSAEIICCEAADLLEAANINGPYELVNFIRSFPEICDKFKIQFPKDPFLVFGDGDAMKQLLKLLGECSPITGDNLANEYERLYGLKKNTLKTKYFKQIVQYQSGGVYDIKTKAITDKQFSKLSGQLKEEWYFSEKVEILFKRRVGKLYDKYMSTNNLALLGYRETSAIIYSNKYDSLEECLEKTDWSSNTFQVSDELWAIPQVNAIIQRKVMNLQIIEYAPQQFIRLGYLKKNGIHKKDLYSFIEAVHQRVEDESYFTLKSLKEEGRDLPLENLGFGDVFYYSILKKSKKVQSRKVAETYLFRKSRKPATLADFYEYLISNLRSIDLFDFAELLSDKYGISINPTYIRNTINGTQMYYDTISEKIYLDYDEYFEEV